MQRIANHTLSSHKCDSLAIIVLLLLFCWGCTEKLAYQLSCPPDLPSLAYKGKIKFTDKSAPTIAVAIADQAETRANGLMCRDSLPTNSGMFFIYPDAEQRTFWMRNTPVPLDIIFIDRHLQIINMAQNTQPNSMSSISSEGDAQYVLEVAAGFCEMYDISVGDRILFTEP